MYPDIGPLDRPWVVLSMIVSIDGAIRVGNTSGGLANDTDRAIFRRLRDRADLIVVGARTAIDEGYRPATRPGQRIAIVSTSGKLPFDNELFAAGSTLVIAPIDGPDLPVTTVRAGVGQADVMAAINELSPRCALVEGGPTLNGQLVSTGAFDELCVTYSPTTVSGPSPRLASGADETLRRFHPAHVLEDDGYLYVRYLRR